MKQRTMEKRVPNQPGGPCHDGESDTTKLHNKVHIPVDEGYTMAWSFQFDAINPVRCALRGVPIAPKQRAVDPINHRPVQRKVAAVPRVQTAKQVVTKKRHHNDAWRRVMKVAASMQKKNTPAHMDHLYKRPVCVPGKPPVKHLQKVPEPMRKPHFAILIEAPMDAPRALQRNNATRAFQRRN